MEAAWISRKYTAASRGTVEIFIFAAYNESIVRSFLIIPENGGFVNRPPITRGMFG